MLENALLTTDLLNQNPTKKVPLLNKKIVVANGYLSRVRNTIITDKIIIIKIT